MNIIEKLDNKSIVSDLNNKKIFVGEFYSFIFHKFVDSGWKIHISCTIKNYKDIMNLVIEYLYVEKINFKIFKDIEIYFENSRKNGDRNSYGKFITIYPNTKKEFIRTIDILYKMLRYFEGPYILSDRRYKDCKVLYYRYGSNVLQGKFDSKGNSIRTYKYRNKTYYDIPKPYFYLPKSIKDPFVDVYKQGNSNYLLKNYDVIDAIKFSPVGGVYIAQDKNENQYIVKEIYPNTNVYDKDNDSITFAKKEIKNLNILKNVGFIPKLKEYFYDWENLYIVKEYVEGDTFEYYLGKNNPIPHFGKNEEVLNYLQEVLLIINIISDYINILYDYGYVITDLGPDNIIVKNDYDKDISFIDLESLEDINDYDNKIISYTDGFWINDLDIEKNIKNQIANLILFSLNKKNNLFSLFEEEQILSPIITRYQFIEELLECIKTIKSESTKLIDISYIINETITSLSKEKYKSNQVISLGYNDYKKIMDLEIKHIEDKLVNRNSIAFGQLGKILSNIYLERKLYTSKDLKEFENDFRTTSLFYGHSGLVYVYNLLNINTKGVVNKIINNIDYTKLSLSEGVSGIGISLIHDYRISKNKKLLKVLKKISNILIKNYLKSKLGKTSISLDEGLLGYALFLIYYASIFKDDESKKYAKKYIDLTYRKIKEDNYFDYITGDYDEYKKEYYIKDGLCGLILVILEYMKEFNVEYDDILLNKLLKEINKVYSISPNFYFGSAGFLYTIYRVKREFSNLDSQNIDVDENIKIFHNDIINTFINNEFMNANSRYNEYGFLGGKEGIITILDYVENEKEFKIFPFII